MEKNNAESKFNEWLQHQVAVKNTTIIDDDDDDDDDDELFLWYG